VHQGTRSADKRAEFIHDKMSYTELRLLYANADHHLGTGSFLQQGTSSADKRAEFDSDMMSYIKLRRSWCDVIFMNMHASVRDKSDEELEPVFGQFT
jgi:hypothetical protein